MATKPSVFLNWTSGLSPSQIVQPPTGKQAVGWLEGEAPAYEYMNWLFYITDIWIQYFEAILGSNYVPNMRLLTTGTFGYVNSTGVLTWTQPINISIPSLPDSYNQIAAGNTTLTDGQIAYIQPNLPFTTTGSITNISNQITGLGSVQGIVVGQQILGTGIPTGTTVTTISGTNVIMSQNATATVSGENITFGSNAALTVFVSTNSTYIPQSGDLIIARRAGSIVFIGLDENGMKIQDGEIKPFLGEGYGPTYVGVAGANLLAGNAVYIAPAGDSGRTQGQVYGLDTSATNGALRHVFVGFVRTGVNLASPVTVVTDGLVNFPTATLVPGTIYYADPSSPAGITATKPTVLNQWIVPVGIALTTTQLMTNAASLGSLATQFGGSGGGGGGGGSLTWVEGLNSPTPEQFNGSQIYLFDMEIEQALTTSIFVPNSYVPGSPINLSTLIYSPDSSGVVTVNTFATLIRTGIDMNGITTNQHQSTNSSIGLTGGTANINQPIKFDLSDASGKINGVSVSPGDLIEIELIRLSDTADSPVGIFVDACAVTFS